MKNITQILLLLWCLATLATAAPVMLAWDANPAPVNYYEVWLGGVRVAVTDRTEIQIDLPTDKCTPLQVVAVGPTGLRSLPAEILAQPFRDHHSGDMQIWSSTPWNFREYTDKAFFKTEYVTP